MSQGRHDLNVFPHGLPAWPSRKTKRLIACALLRLPGGSNRVSLQYMTISSVALPPEVASYKEERDWMKLNVSVAEQRGGLFRA